MRDWLTLGVLVLAWLTLSAAVARFIFTRFPGVVPVAVSPRVTALVVVAIPLGLGLLDVCLYYLGGNESTISYVMLSARAARPLVGLSTVYSFAVLVRHLFFPVYAAESPPPYEVVARMWFVLSPTVYALIIVGNGNGTLAAHQHALEAGGLNWYAVYTLAAAVVGWWAGQFLPQHLLPLSQ